MGEVTQKGAKGMLGYGAHIYVGGQFNGKLPMPSVRGLG